jgi:hypothetical protein
MMRRAGLNPISKERLEQFGGRMPFNSLEKPGQARTAPKVKRWTDTGPDDETVMVVLKRDNWKCACCGDRIYGDRGSEWCIGHRKLRAHGVDNRPANLFVSCMACERETHAGPERARQAGWMLRSTEDPEEVPMEHAVHGTVLLDNNGGYAVIHAVLVREEFDEHSEHPF